MTLPSRSGILIFITVLSFLSGLLLIHRTGENMRSNGLENRIFKKKAEGQLAITSFKKEIDKLAFLVLAIRNQIESIDSIPSAPRLQSLLLGQLNGMNYNNPLVISYLDSNHIFQYSVTRTSINANRLAGTKVQSLRDSAEINRLNNLMKTDELRLFPPLNLIEGWVGIPLSFRIQKQGKTVGYFCPIIDFRSIIDELYNRPSAKEFVYKFSFNDNLIFDRQAVHDGTKVYNNTKDAESYINFETRPEKDFLKNAFSCFGATFNIEIDYKEPYSFNTNQKLLLESWCFLNTVLFSAIGFFLYWHNKKRQELERQSDQLKKYNEALQRFTFATSHDLKEPLRTICAFSSLLERRYKDLLDDKGKEYLDYVIGNSSRMNALLESLQKYTKLIDGLESPKELVGITEVIEDVKESLHVLISESGSRIIVENDFPKVHINKLQMHQVLQNLISNGIKFNDNETREVYIGYEKNNGRDIFFVRDNGIGIDKKHHSKIFESFQQLDKQNYTGSGLGLSICKKIIEEHNGSIWVKSSEGEGSTFYFSVSKG